MMMGPYHQSTWGCSQMFVPASLGTRTLETEVRAVQSASPGSGGPPRTTPTKLFLSRVSLGMAPIGAGGSRKGEGYVPSLLQSWKLSCRVLDDS